MNSSMLVVLFWSSQLTSIDEFRHVFTLTVLLFLIRILKAKQRLKHFMKHCPLVAEDTRDNHSNGAIFSPARGLIVRLAFKEIYCRAADVCIAHV